MAETRDSPRSDEDAETESDGEGSPIKAPEVTETPAAALDADNEEATPKDTSPSKAKSSQDDDIADAEIMSGQKSKPRAQYGKAAARRAKNAMGSDADSPKSLNPDAETANVSEDDDGSDSLDVAENKSPSSRGKLPAVGKGTKRKAGPRRQSAEQTYAISTEDEDRPAKKTRLPKAARDESPEETIAVAPQEKKAAVPQRSSGRTSKTPATPASKDSPTSTPSLLTGRPPKVLLTSCGLNGKTTGWIKKKANVIESTPTRAGYVCVTRHKDLPTTAKVLKTLVAGKTVITDQWVTDSQKEGTLLDLDDYKHPEVEDNGDGSKRSTLFAGKTLFFTTAAMKAYNDNWDAIQGVAKEAGAIAIEEGTATKGDQLTPKHDVVLFGNGDDDKAVEALISEHSRIVYDKAMFAKSILWAELDLESDEFKLKGNNGSGGGKTGGRKK